MSEAESEVEVSDFEYDDSEGEFILDEDEFSGAEYDDDVDNENYQAIQAHSKNWKGRNWKQWRLLDFIKEYFIHGVERIQKKLPQISLSEDDLLILFHYCNWDEERLINMYFDGVEQLLEQAGVLQKKIPGIEKRTDYECLICCNEEESTEIFSLACGHDFCLSCYYNYIKEELPKGNLIRCMIPECNLAIPHRLVHQICQHGNKTKEIAKDALVDNELLFHAARLYVRRHHDTFKRCPSVDCQNLVQLDLSAQFSELDLGDIDPFDKNYRGSDIEVKIVTCSDGHEFCFSCKFENHLPCSCSIVRAWNKKITSDSETYNWIEVNTKGCPKCDTNIEKDGGCNHVKCFKCSYEFCWICLGIWEEHKTSFYNCNRYVPPLPKEEKENRRKRKYLDRYMHFYMRFMEHQSSMTWDLKTLQAITKTTEDYMREKSTDDTKTTSFNEIDYLQLSFKLLVMGRKTLKWTYVFAYYLSESNFQSIFELNQDFLNALVEQLSELFEKILKSKDKMSLVVKLKPELVNTSKLVTTRRLKLIEAARDYLQKGLITFEDGF